MPQVQSEIDELRARLARLEHAGANLRGRTNMVGASRYLDISEETLRRMHERGNGPPRVRIGARGWSYRYDDLDAWLAAQK
jgi:predicted DNA-binding transcriptional regulator AlpA